jgi:hypothetical protein
MPALSKPGIEHIREPVVPDPSEPGEVFEQDLFIGLAVFFKNNPENNVVLMKQLIVCDERF